DGLVEVPCALSAADLATLPGLELRAPFECEEGWKVDLLRWRRRRRLGAGRRGRAVAGAHGGLDGHPAGAASTRRRDHPHRLAGPDAAPVADRRAHAG